MLLRVSRSSQWAKIALLKLAAGRVRDEADVVELIRANPKEVAVIRAHLSAVHRDYVKAFDHLADRAKDQQDA